MSVLGGAELALAGLLGAIDRSQWEPVAVIGEEGPLIDKLTEAGVQVETLPLPASLRRVRQGQIGMGTLLNPRSIAVAFSYIRRLATWLKRAHVDLVHANSLRACVLAGCAGRLASIPVVWHIHSVIGSPEMSSTGRKLLRLLSRNLPSHIICNSAATAADFEAVRDRVTIVPCGVDSDRFAPNGARQHPSPRVGMIARFAPIKGQGVLVHAANELWASHPDAEFLLAGTSLFGEDQYEQRVRELALSGKNRSVRFLGFVEDVPRLLEQLDIVVSPSTQPEGFGQSIVEAMMAGKPVIASALGGPLEVIEEGVTGRLVPPGDALALSRAISEMLDDPERALAMGRRGRERALRLYDIRRTTRQIEQVYEKVLSVT